MTKKLMALVAMVMMLVPMASANPNPMGPQLASSDRWKSIFAQMPENQLVEVPLGTCQTLQNSNCYELHLRPQPGAFVIEAVGIGPMVVVQPELRQMPGRGPVLISVPVVRDIYVKEHGAVVKKSAFFPDVASGTIVLMGKFAYVQQQFRAKLYSGAIGDAISGRLATPSGAVKRETSPSTHMLVRDCVTGMFRPEADFGKRSGGFTKCTSIYQ